MSDKFCVLIKNTWKYFNDGGWIYSRPNYFDNFYNYCSTLSKENGWHINAVINHQLKPHGKLIETTTQGTYLRWDDEKYHTMFVLKWS